MNVPVIQFIDVEKSFGAQQILRKVSLSMETGKTTVIAGGSGQGKSVTLKLILGLVTPDAGQILIDGVDISRMSGRQLNQVRQNFGVLFQGSALLDSLTVFENISLPLTERTKLSREEISKRVLASLEQFGLSGHEHKYPAQLSGGMRKRVGLARALQLQPKIMLFDEPTTGLDPEKAREIYQLFFSTQKQFGYTSIIVSHDIPKVFNLADQIIILNQGQVAIFHNPEDIQLCKIPEIRDFVRRTMGHVYLSSEME